MLVRPDDRIVRLLDPPFAETSRDPGYIKAYPPGIRENGGQYSHAAAWLGIACAIAGRGEQAKEVFDRLNPVLHSHSEESARHYLVEPYVVVADIGGTEPYVGRGGWSWYTGAAGWSWRLATEYILGIRLVDDMIELSPCLPPDWPGYEATIRREGSIVISVRRADRASFTVDGEAQAPAAVPFPGKGKVRRVELDILRYDGAAAGTGQSTPANSAQFARVRSKTIS